jgi:hypothetical protein
VALKDFTAYAKATTERIAKNARKVVTDAGRPVISFDHVKTRNRTQHKDDLAKSIAETDGITEGIICLITPSTQDGDHRAVRGAGDPTSP